MKEQQNKNQKQYKINVFREHWANNFQSARIVGGAKAKKRNHPFSIRIRMYFIRFYEHILVGWIGLGHVHVNKFSDEIYTDTQIIQNDASLLTVHR